jgi:hypothetical protein
VTKPIVEDAPSSDTLRSASDASPAAPRFHQVLLAALVAAFCYGTLAALAWQQVQRVHALVAPGARPWPTPIDTPDADGTTSRRAGMHRSANGQGNVESGSAIHDSARQPRALGALQPVAAALALQGAAAAAVRCYGDQIAVPSSITVIVIFAPSGQAAAARIEVGGDRGAAERACLEAVFRSVRVPRFAGGPLRVRKQVRLR